MKPDLSVTRTPVRNVISVLLLSVITMTPAAIMSLIPSGSALAVVGAGVGADGGAGNAKATIKELTQADFLKRNKTDHKLLLALDGREDSEVHIAGFPSHASKYLLEAIIYDSRRIRRLFKSLAGVSDNSKRQGIIKKALTRASAKEALLEKDVQTTERQISQEKNKIEQARKGVLKKPFVKTKRLIALETALETQRLQHERAQRVTSFLQSWLSRPHWGR